MSQDPTYPELVAQLADLRDQLREVTEERDEYRDQLDEIEYQRNRERRLTYLSRGWG